MKAPGFASTLTALYFIPEAREIQFFFLTINYVINMF
uniref:Uncharacterized protein n=1 Tax=Anguilla anguilla TaxID=7936 RepID=A0A0E9PYJ8_ANGAN